MNQFQLAIAQQEAVYAMARQNQKHVAPDPQDTSIKPVDQSGEPQPFDEDADAPLTNEHDISDEHINNSNEVSGVVSESPSDVKAGFLRQKSMTKSKV